MAKTPKKTASNPFLGDVNMDDEIRKFYSVTENQLRDMILDLQSQMRQMREEMDALRKDVRIYDRNLFELLIANEVSRYNVASTKSS